MQLTAVSIVVLLPLMAFSASGIERRQSSLDSANIRECWDIAYRHVCVDTNDTQVEAHVYLECGPNYIPHAENIVARCSKDSNGEFCFHLLFDSPLYSARNIRSLVAPCTTVVNTTSPCPDRCQNYLQAAVKEGGCCFLTVYNERLSQHILGHNIEVSLEACNVDAPLPCDTAFDLPPVTRNDSCTTAEFWSHVSSEYLCDTQRGQAWIDALLKNPVCTPLARHRVNRCGRGVDNRFCTDLFGTSVNPFSPFSTLGIHAESSEVLNQCINSSSFQSEGCPAHCRDALQAAVDAVGCCINIFDDPVNEISHPHFADEVLAACGIKDPGMCKSPLTIRAGSITVKAVGVWMYVLCVAFLYVLN